MVLCVGCCMLRLCAVLLFHCAVVLGVLCAVCVVLGIVCVVHRALYAVLCSVLCPGVVWCQVEWGGVL